MGMTPLHVAVRHPSQAYDTVRLLLEHDSDVTVQDGYGQTPLCAACRGGGFFVELLLIAGAGSTLETPDQVWKRTPLHWTCCNGNVCGTQHLLKAGADTMATDGSNHIPFHLACQSGILDLVRLLLKKNKKQKSMMGSSEGYLQSKEEERRELSKYENSMIHQKDKHNNTPLHFAAQAQDPRPNDDRRTQHEFNPQGVMDLLLEKGAVVDATNQSRETALHKAIQTGHHSTARFLLDHGASHDVQTGSGLSPLHIACEKRCMASVQMLVDKGADPFAATKNGLEPWHVAAQQNDAEIVWYLLQKHPSLATR